MAKGFKRTVSLLLILLMVATCVCSAFSVQAASDVLFKDDFSSSALSGWSANNVGTISGGKYTIEGTGANAVTALGSKKGVAILAEVAIDRTAAGNDGKFYNGGTAGLVFHATQDLSSGYTFGLGINKSGTVYALVTLASGGSTKIVYQRSLQIAGVTGGKLKRNTQYDLKVLMEGDTFGCYINNELFYQCDTPAVKEGYVGVSSWCAKGMFADFAVREMGKKVLESITLENTPAEITSAGYFEFDIIANYSGVYGAKRISSESAGVTVTGIDGKLGQKTLTVGYGGKKASFTTNVVKSTEGAVVYEQNFDGEVTNWTFTENKTSGINKMKVENGRLVAVMPKNTNGSYSLLANYKEVDAVADGYYTISADATMTADSTSADKERKCIAVLRFVNAGGVWQFRAYSTGEVRLYDGATTLLATAECAQAALGKTINMKVELRGESVVCYINNKEVLSAQIPATEITPYLGVAVYDGSAYFDNFKVTKLEKKSKWAIRSMHVVNANGEKCTSYAGRVFEPQKFALNITYVDGVVGSVTLREDMLQGYDAANKNTQKVKIVYGNKTIDFTITYKEYLYYNDFSENMAGITVSGNSAGSKYMPVKLSRGYAEIGYNKPADGSTTRRTLKIDDSANYGNISISADVAVLDGNIGKGQYVGFDVRNTKGTSYSYRLVNDNNGFSLHLYHNHQNSGNIIMRKWPAATLLATYGDQEAVIGLNVLYNLKLEVVENTIYCYFNHKLIDVITDTEKNYTYTTGGGSLLAINTGAIFDNVYIYPIEERSLVSAGVSGSWVKDGVVQLYQGMDIDPDEVTLLLQYSDGFTIEHPLWSDYIVENYDPTKLGEQTITVEYQGVTKKIRVNVSDRPDYVAAFENKVKSFKKGSLTSADLPALNEMVDYFDTLTTYEVAHMNQDVYKLYVDLVAEMDRVETPELKDVDLIYYNDFSTTQDFRNEWQVDNTCGDSVVRNGYYINEMKKHGLMSTTQMYAPASYGELKSVEADVMMPYAGTIAAVMIYASPQTYYHVRLNNKLVDTNGMPIAGVQLYKYTGGGHIKLAQVYPALKNVVVEEGKWNNLRIALNNGLVSVYLDDELMIQYDDSQSTDFITDGFAGMRISENDAAIDNLKVYGIKKDIPKNDYEKQITPTEYKDDFEDETVGKNPSHWIEDNYTDYWKVFNKAGNKVYGITKNEHSWTWLHAFEKDPVYKAKIMVTTGSGKAGLLARVTDKVSYLEMGYDFAQKKWYIEADGSEDVATHTYYAPETSAFALGEWHDIEVHPQDEKVTITFDGKEVLTYDAVPYASIGRMGAYVKNADLYIDDVYIKSVLGTNFDDGVLEYVINSETRIGTLELEDLSEDHLLGHYNSGVLYESTDGGQTFKVPGPDSDYYLHEFETGYPSYIDLGNDRWLRIVAGHASQLSTDDMRTWEPMVEIFPDSERYDTITGKEKSLVHTSTLTKATLKDGTVRVFCPIAFRNVSNTGSILGHYTRFFYTDDEGKTWQEAENDTRDFAPIYNNSASTTWSEGKIIQCSDGTLRYYQTRNVVGALIYFESADDGVTWGNFGTIPFMQAPKGSFGIEEDPYNPGTYYMAWVNCYPVSLGGILPRTRLSLARTTDGKNWEFLTDVDRTSDFHSDSASDIRQIVDPGVCVTKDYVHVTFSRASKYAPQAHNYLLIRYCRFEKSKLTARAWDDSTIYDTMQAASIQVAGTPQTKFGYADLFSTNGLQIEVTSINGRKIVGGAKGFDIVQEPNMFKLGKQTITLMSQNYLFTSYEIEVVPNYDLVWTIKGKGTVDPDPDATLRMMEGATQTFTLKPAKGYKVSYVTLNGKKAKIKKNTFTIANVQENQEVVVSFVKLTIMDYLLWIILGVVVVAGIGVGCVLLIPRLKKKKAAAGEMEDISSTSNPPSDEN